MTPDVSPPQRPDPVRPARSPVHPAVDRLAAYGWRLLIIAAAGAAILWLIGQLWVVVFSVVVALFLTRVMIGPATVLRRRGLPPLLVAAVMMVGFAGVLTVIGSFIVPAVADEFGALGPTISDAVDDVERWLVEDSPFNLDRGDLRDLRKQGGDALGRALRSSSGAVVSGALLLVEVVVGVLLAVITTFFMLKDGDRFLAWLRSWIPQPRRELAARLAGRAWWTLGGYLRGAALLGLTESVVIAVTLAIVGADLVLPVAILTFLAAFVPFVGAIASGIVAVLVALVTTGVTGAVVVGAVAVAVQQVDNDLLAPVVYGRSLDVHPLTILFSITAGGALFGIVGSVMAVPVAAVVINVMAEARRETDEEATGGELRPGGA